MVDCTKSQRSTVSRLTTLFSALLVPAVGGCGPEKGGGSTLDESFFTEDVCATEGSTPRFLAGVSPAMSVDYLELREVETFGVIDPLDPPPISVLDMTGQFCASATDMAACATAFVELPLESDMYAPYSFDILYMRSLAYTRGDEVGSITMRGQLPAFLGDLDTLEDAGLFAWLNGHEIVCGPGDNAGEHPDGWVFRTRTGTGCGDDIVEHVMLIRPDGSIVEIDSEVVEKGDPGCAIGRLPHGLCWPRGEKRSTARKPVGAFMARVAELEASAVPAFERFERELLDHGAPHALVRRARRARRDEVRHARKTRRLAAQYGGKPRTPQVRPAASRSLLDLAIDNAQEGCVRETYGALVAHVQAKRARCAEVRALFAEIAADETRHAALSWDVHRWALARLDDEGRAAVERALNQALGDLEGPLTRELPASVCSELGMPSKAEASSLYAHFRALGPRALA